MRNRDVAFFRVSGEARAGGRADHGARNAHTHARRGRDDGEHVTPPRSAVIVLARRSSPRARSANRRVRPGGFRHRATTTIVLSIFPERRLSRDSWGHASRRSSTARARPLIDTSDKR